MPVELGERVGSRCEDERRRERRHAEERNHQAEEAAVACRRASSDARPAPRVAALRRDVRVPVVRIGGLPLGLVDPVGPQASIGRSIRRP